MTTRHMTVDTVLGALLVVADDDAVTGVYFPAHRYPPSPDAIGPSVRSDALITTAQGQLTDYLDGGRRDFDLPLAPVGSTFDQEVWNLLRAIPFGETTSYGALAQQMGNPRLAQRVGQSVGHNPISIIVPCHRVVGADGGLTGFAGGLERKRFLLDLEAPADSRLF